MYILSPDKTSFILKLYHKSNKAILPLILASVSSHSIDQKESIKVFDTLNTLNIAFHSYVSCSCIMTDYIKPKYLARGSRILSLGLHSLAIVGYLNKIHYEDKGFIKK